MGDLPTNARKLRGYVLDARLIASHFVTPYRMAGKGGKNDAAARPYMRFVPIKTPAHLARRAAACKASSLKLPIVCRGQGD